MSYMIFLRACFLKILPPATAHRQDPKAPTIPDYECRGTLSNLAMRPRGGGFGGTIFWLRVADGRATKGGEQDRAGKTNCNF